MTTKMMMVMMVRSVNEDSVFMIMMRTMIGDDEYDEESKRGQSVFDYDDGNNDYDDVDGDGDDEDDEECKRGQCVKAEQAGIHHEVGRE